MIANIPDARVIVDGKDITPLLFGKVRSPAGPARNRLISLTIAEKRGEEADSLDLAIDDSDGAIDLPPTGATISVAIGWRQGSGVTPGLVDKGSYIVDSVSHAGPPDVLTIKAHAADLNAGLKARREKGWHDTTLGDIVQDIAGRHKLTPNCAPALAALAVATKIQSRESDLAFLRRIGREYDAAVTIKKGVLIVKPIGDGLTASGKALPTVTIQRNEAGAHQFERQKRDDSDGVTASWHDRKAGKPAKVTAGTGKNSRKLSRVYGSETEARAAADAAHARAGREPMTFSITLALGRADLHPEQKARVSGFKSAIDAVDWLIGEVSHSIGDQGYQTQIKLETGGDQKSSTA